MARSDLLMSLVQAASRGDQALFRRTLEALVAEERAKQHHILADQLAAYLKEPIATPRSPALSERTHDYVAVITPKKALGELILTQQTFQSVNELIEEHHRRELLRSYNLEPRNRVLLVGPPGNGKTSLAEAIASGMLAPLYVVRYEGVIGSYLGETALRLRELFDYVRLHQCVLFFDEFDTLGKERGDDHETGEIKRVVSSLLLQIDSLPSHVVIITATNHPELLDRAVWRRFQLRLALPRPTRSQLEVWFKRFEERFGHELGYSPRTLADRLYGRSFAEAETFATDVLRRFVLGLPDSRVREIVAERLRLLSAEVDASSGGGQDGE